VTVAPPETAGRSFAADEALLAEVLEEVVGATAGREALALHRRAVELGSRSRSGDADAAEALAALVGGAGTDALELLIRSLTRWFELVNLAEDNERVRRLHRRELDDAPAPRRGSLRDAVVRLAAGGTTAAELHETLARAEVRLVMTAHPTEARRRTTLAKLARIFGMLRALDERRTLPGEAERFRGRIAETVQELWGSDELRAVSPSVLDEVRAGLVYFTSTLVEVVPAVYRDLEAALAESFGEGAVAVPPLLTFGSWMGGDRDGNPNVTPAVTAEALALMRESCLHHLERSVTQLAERVSLSVRVVGEPAELAGLLDDLGARFPAAGAELAGRNPEEPYRRVFSLLAERIGATRSRRAEGFGGPAELLSDLRAVATSLRSRGAGFVAAGELSDVIRQVEVFGFHFARLDVREHARIHRAAVGRILSELGIQEDYAELAEPERLAILVREISDPRPLIPQDLSGFDGSTQEAVETFRTIRDLLDDGHAGAIQAYVVSGTSGPADLLEVLLLLKETSLARAGGHGARLRIVPLFESGETLAHAARTMRVLLGTPVYRAALDAVGGEQEIMVGYSDSNKDVGYLASGWGVHRAQLQLASALREHGATWQFFHGRGGAVGRGGGPSNVAILAQPPGTVAGRLKVTEQGEVLSAKFAVTEIAHRELELTTSAALVSTLDGSGAVAPDRLDRFETVLEDMAESSTRVYRELVYGDPDFSDFFHAATPVQEISRLQLGSRPARRRPSRAIEDLRAIPWVFAWTQARIVLPAWYGFGTALEAAREAHGEAILREMNAEWPFFAALVSNSEMACAKADLEIARRYAELYGDVAARERIWSAITREFALTRDELERVRGEERLLDREPVLQKSIDRRNPFVDPLSFVQLELLRRLRSGEGDDPALLRASLLAVNGIAGGLRNTG